MSCPLRILYLEDDIADAELARDTLEVDGFSCDVTRVDMESGFRAALQHGGFDVILADYALPSFDGLSALKITLRQRPDLPFIFVSGTMGEEVAIEALKVGATDYVLKTRMSRLVPSVNRALREARERAELRRAEEALRRSEAYLAIAQGLSHTGSFGWDVASGEIFWSLETYRIFELDPTTKPTLDFILQRVHPDDRLRVKETFDRISLDRTDFQFEHRLLMADRRVKYLRVSSRAAQNSSADTDVVGAVTDITATKEAERELQERDAKIRRLVDSNIVGVLISDLAGRVIDANDAFLQMVRYTRDDVACGRLRWTELTPPEWQAASERAVAQLGTNGTCELFEKEYFRSDGTRVPVLVAAAVIEGTKTENVAFVLDLSEQKQAEEALRKSENYLAEAQRLTHTGSCAIDGTSREILYWSEEMFRLFGFDPQQGLPMWDQWLQRIHPEDRDKFRMAGDRTFLEKVHCDVEFRAVKPDGTIKHIHGIGDPVLSPSGELVQVVGTMVDVTERRRAEEARDRLRQLEADLAHINRVSTMGELTASLAHEINQPIGAAVTNAQACLRFLNCGQPDLPEAREAAQEMVRDARRAADIIDRVRSLYRKGQAHQEMVDVNEVIREMAVMLHKEANRYSVDMRAELCENLPNVVADRVQLQQVLMNLMMNGIEAMRDAGMGGELSVKSQLAEDGQLLISVSDTGVGLPTGKADEIFNAFFTTKPQGTGMGLAITRSIVESHGGSVWATANSGPGSAFHFTLPQKMGAHA